MKTKTKTKNLKQSRTMKFRTMNDQERIEFEKNRHLRFLQNPSYTYCESCNSHWHYEEIKEDGVCPECNNLII